MNPFASHFESVKEIFHQVAHRYDLMNDLMSLGIHRHWKRQFIRYLSIQPGGCYMDLAAGSGDVTELIHRKMMQHGFTPNIVAVDPNESMIQQGKAKLMDQGIVQGVRWVQAAAENLPFEDESMQAVLISFGLRNVSDISACLKEIYRILKPGGQFLCLEFSQVQTPLLQFLYKGYRHAVIPKLGEWVTGNKAAYEYLDQSIEKFDDQGTLRQKIEMAGFHHVHYVNLTQGIVAIHEGWKL